MNNPTASIDVVEDGSRMTLQSMMSAQKLNEDAMGPNVPAMSGNRVDENHHRLCDEDD